MSRPGWVALFLVLVAVLAVGGFLAVDRLAGDEREETAVEKPELGTAAVVTTDLRRLETFPATLRYSEQRNVIAAAGGIVTRVPVEGTELARGDPIIEVDGQPVFVFYGERPMWRSLGLAPDGSGMEGPDVEQLEVNLEALGYLPRSRPDQVLDADTVRLIRAWRTDAGLEGSASVELGRIVYADGLIRVSRNLVVEGALLVPGVPMVEVSGTVQEVRMELSVDRRDRVSVGEGVAVRLPDDVTSAGIVQEIGTVVFAAGVDRRGPDYVEVTIHLDDPRLGAQYHGYPVDVEIVTDQAVGVMAVPVKALVALSEGGYAVEVERAGEVALVGVETGMYADGLVEVQGDLDPGDLVRLPK